LSQKKPFKITLQALAKKIEEKKTRVKTETKIRHLNKKRKRGFSPLEPSMVVFSASS
jgi:hypothetical protein